MKRCLKVEMDVQLVWCSLVWQIIFVEISFVKYNSIKGCYIVKMGPDKKEM